MSSYQDLVAQLNELEKQKADLDKQIAQKKREERSGVIAQIKSLMAEHDLTAEDISGSGKVRSASSKSTNAGGRQKVAPKYRNPQTGDSWSGRGLQPRWLKTALAEGRKLEDFSI